MHLNGARQGKRLDIVDDFLSTEDVPQLPIDLRKTMISQMVVTGGLSMLPGFFSRFRTELVHSLSKARSVADAQVSQKQQRSRVSPQIPRRTESTRFHSISAMYAHVAILNDPCLPASEGDDTIHENAGTAPGFAPSVLGWIGASLSVALKTGGTEMSREQWSEVRMASVKVKSEDYLDVAVEYGLQDWTMPSLAVRA